MLKKKKPVTPITPREQEVEEERYYESESLQPAPQKPTSFEDLLKEISQEFTDRKEPIPTISAIEEPVQIVEPEVDHSTHTREREYVERRHREMAIEDKAKELKRIDAEEDEYRPHDVLELLEENGGAAKAVILSEILNKKY